MGAAPADPSVNAVMISWAPQYTPRPRPRWPLISWYDRLSAPLAETPSSISAGITTAHIAATKIPGKKQMPVVSISRIEITMIGPKRRTDARNAFPASWTVSVYAPATMPDAVAVTKQFANVEIKEANGSLLAENKGLSIRLPDETAQRLRSHVGRAVTLGVRPEDLYVATAADPEHLSFNAVVEVIEQLGSEIVLDTKVGDSTMVACVEPTLRTKMHEQLRLAIRPTKLHVFDAATDAAI